MDQRPKERVSFFCHGFLTVASIPHPQTGVIAYGTALVGGFQDKPNGDQPSRPRGREIALGRARKVLSEFLTTPAGVVKDFGLPNASLGMPKMRHSWVVDARLDAREMMRLLRQAEKRTQGEVASLVRREHPTMSPPKGAESTINVIWSQSIYELVADTLGKAAHDFYTGRRPATESQAS